MSYRFNLKDNSQKAYRFFVWFLFFLHIVAAGVIGLSAANRDIKLSVYFLLGVYAVVSIFYFFFRKNRRAFETYSLIMALLYADFWLQHVGVTGLLIFLAIYVFVTVIQLKKTTVVLSEGGIHLKRVFTTIIYPWQELDNIILKDNLLTIDLRSNKLIQAELAAGNENVDEISFNRFCKEQLDNNSNKRL
jgi:hypothetical protein